MKGWLDNFGKADNANESNVSLPEGFVGLGYNIKGRNYSPAWGGQFQMGGKLNPISPTQQIIGQAPNASPTVPYLQTKDPAEFYKSWIQSPEYEKRQLATGYVASPEDQSLLVPSAQKSRQTRLGALENISPITYNSREASKATPGLYGSPSYVNINPADYVDTSRESIVAHELAHIAGAAIPEGNTRPGIMSGREQEIFKNSMLPMKEPVLSGVQGSKEREASKRSLEDFQHSQKPQEAKADLDALRFMMYDKGIYDITKGNKFTETDFEKAKQNLGKDRVFKRLENRMGKKNFVNLMNTIASTDGQEEVPIAMGGMSIPGSVGFTYARVAGAAPSKGKYAKKTMASAQKGKQVQKGVDSTLENIFEVVDPTGMSSWDDVYNSYQKSGMSPETKFEIFGALPILGKVGKAGKLLGPALSAGQTSKRIKTNANVVSNVMQSIPYVGRGTDATQAVQQFSDVPFFPTAPPAGVGQFGMYAGMPVFNKKEYGGEIPSAQNGIMSPMLLARNVLNYFYPSEEATSTVSAAPVEYKKGLTNELLQRQAYKESTFNPAAVSPAGYKGLTQIGEGVLKDYSNKKGGQKLDPFNPKDAVELQKFAMDDLYNASFINKPDQPDSVRIAKTLAAYNWGRGNLFNYLNEQKQKGVDIYGSYDWLNDLPKETSDYVNKILLQEDPSFNKNYKKASTNPKYEEVTSLYDQKKFGGDILSAQNGKNDIEKISINDPRYPELYKNRQVGAYYDGAYSLPDLDEVTITAPRSYTMDSLRDFTTAALYGAPATAMKLEAIPQAAMTETIEMLRGRPYDFSNVNPNIGSFSSNQRDLSQTLGYENPEGFLQNAVNLGLSAIDPVLIAGATSMLRKPLQKELAKSLSKNFKSEINWAKWNKEIPKNKPLLQEYNAIEQQTKIDGTWMKNPDGTDFDGTPEEFIQQNSSNFKKVYPDGAFTTYKGVSAQGRMDNLRDPDGEWTRPFFAGDKNIADVFTSQYHTSKSPIISHNNKKFNPNANPEVHKFIISKSPNSLRVDAKGGHWAGFEIPENSIPGLGTRTGTPELQRYVQDKGLDYITIDNLLEGGGGAAKGTIHIINPRRNNIPKSAIGNSGMFDMTNPNIYKGVIPAGIATALSIDQQRNGGKVTTAQNGQEMRFYQNGLDWKPKSMQEGGKMYEGQELPEFVVEGKDERIKEAMSQGINKFYGHVGELMGAPQKEMMQLITGKEQTPSQAFGFQNTGGWLDNYSSFGKNFSNFAMDAALDPVNLIGVGIADDIARTTLKGASKKLASSLDDVSKSFKSEIDWSKWNPDTPKYPELIKEYNKIEEATKKAGTWMQNPDGSVFKGTPEQFIQEQSSYFKKAYPKGYNQVYRGVAPNTSFANLDESADPGLRGSRGIFTGDKELASNYVYGPQGWTQEKPILTPFDPDNTPGLFELIYPKGKEITRYQNLDHWTNINLGKTPTKDDLKYSIDNLKGGLNRRKKIAKELELTEGMPAIAEQANVEIKRQEDLIARLQNYYDNFDNVANDEVAFNKMKKALGDETTTDDIARYIPKTNLRSITLKDIIDSGRGDVTIVNNRPGNYLKSMVGNVGFFDLKNPNVYKGIVPAGIATSLTFDQQKNGGITKDNQGYWNPENWGKPVEIDSNDITMEGVYEPLLGISDTGDTKLMKPGKNYKFKGKKVTEYPVAKLGINQLDAQPMKKLNQLLNFTNNPDKDNWLDKYN